MAKYYGDISFVCGMRSEPIEKTTPFVNLTRYIFELFEEPVNKTISTIESVVFEMIPRPIVSDAPSVSADVHAPSQQKVSVL